MTNQIEYRVGDDIMTIIENSCYNFLNRKDFTSPDSESKLTISTGLAGLKQVQNAIKQRAINLGLVINASDIGTINSYSNSEKDYSITTYTIPFLATIKIILNTEYDSEITNDYIQGWIKTSYNYKIVDDESKKEINIIAIGERPIFKHELMKLINECALDEEYNLPTYNLMKYIMNCLGNLK